MAGVKRDHDVISISSDSGDENPDGFARPPKRARRHQAHLDHQNMQDDYLGDMMDSQLERLLQREQGATPSAAFGNSAESPPTIGSSDDDFGPEADFNRVLAIFPGISHNHVQALFRTHNYDTNAVMEALLTTEKYPTKKDELVAQEAERQAALRLQKELEEAEEARLLNPECQFSGKMKDVIIEILRDEFNTIPIKYIREVQKEHTHLYATYSALAKAMYVDVVPYGKTPGRPKKDIDFNLLAITKHHRANIPILKDQLLAARASADKFELERRRELEEKKMYKANEERNLESAKANGTLVECSACYDDCPRNRSVQCNTGDHYVCFECMKTYLASEIGQSSFKLACPGGCNDTFGVLELQAVTDALTLTAELMRLRQEDGLRSANIEGLEECPFCDFKIVCPPIHIDFEFHCQNEDCDITSCRKCKEKTHVPESCEEYQRRRAKERSKDAALNHRHKIEEARSMALIRNCNKCKRAFIKIEGCNKMTCPTCHNMQCYLCGINVTGNYAHFNLPGSKCPTFDTDMTIEQRHDQEINAAAEAAQAEVMQDNPELAVEHLNIFAENATRSEERKPVPRPQRPRVPHPDLPPFEFHFLYANPVDQLPNIPHHRLGRLGAAMQRFGAAIVRRPMAPHQAADEDQVDAGANDPFAEDMAPRRNMDNLMLPPMRVPYLDDGGLDFNFNLGPQPGAARHNNGFYPDYDPNLAAAPRVPAMGPARPRLPPPLPPHLPVMVRADAPVPPRAAMGARGGGRGRRGPALPAIPALPLVRGAIPPRLPPMPQARPPIPPGGVNNYYPGLDDEIL